jgi:dihydrofolate reductase
MSRVRVHNFSVSIDGFATGEGQSLDAPFGHAGTRLHEWFFPTRTFQQMLGKPDGSTGVDDAIAGTWDVGIGDDWNGWWGPNPPFHTPVFVLTHHPRPSVEMEGGTTFHFIDATPQEALRQAREAAGDLDVRIGGGPTTIREFLVEDLIDHLHIAVVPIVLGRGERLWDGLEGLEKRFQAESVTTPSGVTHMTFIRP